LQFMVDAVTSLVWSVVSALAVPTILLLLFRWLVPVLGEAVWRGYCQLLIWLVVAPVRLIRILVRAAADRRGL